MRLEGRALDILIALLERQGELVTRRELMDIVWPDTLVLKTTLTVHISVLRRALVTVSRAIDTSSMSPDRVIADPGSARLCASWLRSAEPSEVAGWVAVLQPINDSVAERIERLVSR